VEDNVLLEEPELETLADIDVECSADDLKKNYRDLEHYAKQETLSLEEIIYKTLDDVEKVCTNEELEENKEETNEDTTQNINPITNVDNIKEQVNEIH
jgi:hypothetical protein